MSIRHLPQDVCDKITSAVIITSLDDVICGLVKNSLDADANKLNVYVDFGRGDCTVEDNGQGIAPDEFKTDGGLGKLHYTSRYPPSTEKFGKHGDFIASLGNFSLLSVASHHWQYAKHSVLSIHNSRVIARHVPCASDQRSLVFDHGTRVTVRDLFGSMPVRVKHRAALTADQSHIDREWDRLVHRVVALLLAWPRTVNLLLRNTATQRELRIRFPEATPGLPRTPKLLVQAALLESADLESWIPVSASAGQIRVKGSISLTPAASRRAQFLSLGVHPILNDHGANELYEEINRMFAASSFALVEDDDCQGYRASSRPRKTIEKWPMFFLRILLPQPEQSLGDEVLHGSFSVIPTLLKAVCEGFLDKHHFRPGRTVDISRKTPTDTQAAPKQYGESPKGGNGRSAPVPADRSSQQAGPKFSPFDGWNRIKVGIPTRSARLREKHEQSHPAPLIEPSQRLVGEGGRLLRKPFDTPTIKSPKGANRNSESSVSGSSTSSKSRRGSSEAETTSQPKQWLEDVLQSWENPVFENVESAVPHICAIHEHPEGVSGSDARALHNEGLGTGGAHSKGNLSKAALAKAEVVNQVDQKFLLIKLRLTGQKSPDQSPSLVLVDQHAADERCRLEYLMRDYFNRDPDSGKTHAVVESLGRPILFEVAAKDGGLLERYRTHFQAWGIYYTVDIGKQVASVSASALPPSIIERCRTEPRLLIDLLRREIWSLHESGRTPSRPEMNVALEHPWISCFHNCPRGILEALHSRSCRSAIMFNDVLSIEECEQLVRRLAHCAFPFQCAHGRPSMVPLLDLGKSSSASPWAERAEAKQSDRWKEWLSG